MATVKIEESKVLAAYNAADEATKKLLEEMCGGKIALKPIGKITSVEDAFKQLGRNIPESDYEKICGIIEAYNNGWKPDWSDGSEPKYYIWWNMDPSDFGFADVSDQYRFSNVSSRLCFRNGKDAETCAKQFKSLWRKYMLNED